MTAPAWATNLSTFWLTGATTVTALGGGASGLGNPETDFFIQGTDCLSKAAWTNALKGFIVDALGTTFTVPTDGAIIVFAKYDAAGSLDTKANGGLRLIVGSSAADYYHLYVGGKDTIAYFSWVPYVFDPNTATVDNTTGTPSGSERWVGVLGFLPTTSGPTKGNPIAIDAIRYGRCDLEYTFGDGTSGYNTFAAAEAVANSVTNRYGLIEFIQGAYLIQGYHSLGTASSLVDFRDSNKVVFWRPSGENNLTGDSVSVNFNKIEILNASSNVDWDNIIFQSLGSRARGLLVHTAGTFDATNCQFVDMDTFSLLSTSVMTDCTFRRTNAITAPGSTLVGSKVLTPTVAADTSGVIWNVATDPDGYLDDMEFSKGTNSHHAIEFGTTSPLTMTLRGCAFTGFNATAGNTDSALHVKRTTGTVTIYLVACSGSISYKTDGATVVLIADPVTVSLEVKTATGTAITGAQTFVKAKDGTGPMPYQDVVTIVNSGTTATVTHTAHGMASNDKVLIENASLDANNGVFTITYISVDSYSYTMGSSPGSSPTGTILSTYVALYGTTDGTGKISMSRVFSSNQPVTGYARKSSGAPYYKTGPVDGIINSSTGVSLSTVLVSDD